MQPVSARDSILGTYHCKCGLPASDRGTLGGVLKSIDWVQLVEYLERCSTGNGPTCIVIPEQPDSDLDTLSKGGLTPGCDCAPQVMAPSDHLQVGIFKLASSSWHLR